MTGFRIYSVASAIALAAVGLTAQGAHAQTATSTTFATGTAVSANSPDSVTVGDGSVWIEYGNGASSTTPPGQDGSSTIVRYSTSGAVQNTFSIAGSVDGLKYNPYTNSVWALQNQDANARLSIINPTTNTVGPSIPYAVTSQTQGYDDAVFTPSATYLSYTNPAAPTDPIIQKFTPGTNPIAVTPVLTFGATGKNVATGVTGTIVANDPDSLKQAPNGDLVLSSGDDGTIITVHNPGASQTVSYLQLLNPDGTAGSKLDDTLVIDGSNETVLLTDTASNKVLDVSLTGLTPGDLLASLGSAKGIVEVDPTTGVSTLVLPGFSSPHGLAELAVPEPATIALFGFGIAGLAAARRRRA